MQERIECRLKTIEKKFNKSLSNPTLEGFLLQRGVGG